MTPWRERANPAPIGSGETSQRADVQLVERPRRGHYIDDRIDCADLMEMNVIARGAMNLGLGVTERFERWRSALAVGARGLKLGGLDHRKDFAEVPFGLRLR
jgi:hypothetical protein